MHYSPILLGALTDDELGGFSAWRVRRHLAHCPTCQQELAALEGLGQTLRAASPLPTRKPIRRPIGIVCTGVATLAMACTVAALCMRLPAPSETESETRPESARALRVRKPQQAPLPAPKAPPTALPTALVASPLPRQPHLQVARRKRHCKPLAAAKASPRPKPKTEQIIVIATVMPPPKPVTVILDNNDNDGGTIHIESTIPAAYVVAMQKELN